MRLATLWRAAFAAPTAAVPSDTSSPTRCAGRSRTLYVPVAMAEEVRQWTQNWKLAKRLLRELSEISLEEVRSGARDAVPQQPRETH